VRTRRFTPSLALMALISLAPAAKAAELEFPYEAYINADDVYVRSGPGRDYYPTDKLRKGDAVEVYRHDPGGWLAIRPPRGSFCWVSSRHLDQLEDNLAAVNSERVVARVGSSFSDVRDVIQVRLERDEKVEILEQPSPESPWCKIAPPAGEFRWIFAKYVDHELPAEVAADEREAGRAYRAADGVRLAGGDDESSVDQADEHRQFAGDVERLRELERIDLDLTNIVTTDLSEWSFDALRERAERALENAEGSLERGRARVLLDKLARFDEIKKRHDSLAVAPAVAGPAAAARTPWSGVDDARFDGVGKLSPVVSQSTGGPQYALMDDKGAVLSFVTPAPGVNLRPYVDKQVGVNGQRGYLTDLKRQHISVQRVTLLDATRR
jgi:uncharacterized protein YgiM (DUF1202 family)